MITNETEAAKKWCRFALPVPHQNRQGDGTMYYGTYCIGSSCMAWQWVEQDERLVNGQIVYAGSARKGTCGANHTNVFNVGI